MRQMADINAVCIGFVKHIVLLSAQQQSEVVFMISRSPAWDFCFDFARSSVFKRSQAIEVIRGAMTQGAGDKLT